MNAPNYTARRSAVYLLDQVLGEGRLMSDLIASGKLGPDWSQQTVRGHNGWPMTRCAV